MRSFALAFLVACTGSAPTPPVQGSSEEPVEEPPEPDGPPVVKASKAVGVSWRSAWPVDGGVVVPGGSEGRLLGLEGTVDVSSAAACGDAARFAAEGVLWLPPGEPVSFFKTPTVTAAIVERAAWRLADLVGPGEGITPGVTVKDPALHWGIRVRSVRKVRRQGPPWQVVVGERGPDVLVALTDRDADKLVNGVVLRRSASTSMDTVVIPPADLDGDGSEELVVAGDASGGGFRAVLGVDLKQGLLDVRSFEEGHAPSCSTP